MNNEKLVRWQKREIGRVAMVAILDYSNLGTLSTISIYFCLLSISPCKHIWSQKKMAFARHFTFVMGLSEEWRSIFKEKTFRAGFSSAGNSWVGEKWSQTWIWVWSQLWRWWNLCLRNQARFIWASYLLRTKMVLRMCRLKVKFTQQHPKMFLYLFLKALLLADFLFKQN